MPNELTPTKPEALDGEILLPGEPDHPNQKDTGDTGCERYMLGVFEDYVTAELMLLTQRLGQNNFYGNFCNATFSLREDGGDDEGHCTCGFEQRDNKWHKDYRHGIHCNLKAVDQRTIGHFAFEESPFKGKLECDCGRETAYQEWRKTNNHDPNCAQTIPNFRCGDIEFDWYKHLGRRMRANRIVTMRELRTMFDKCRASLG